MRRGTIWSVLGVISLILWATCGAGAADRRIDKSRLIIATFNAEFLWDGLDPEEGSVNFPWKGSPDEADLHMRRVADVIRQLNADLVNLVEVENLETLELMNSRYLSGYGYRAYLVKGKDTATGQDVALLTRIDPDEFDRHNGKGASGSLQKDVSKNYFAKLTVSGQKIGLVGIHLLARPNDPNRAEQRQAQANAIENLAVSLRAAGYEPIVLGDFNDYEGNAGCTDHQDSQPTTNVLEILRRMGTPANDNDLINVHCSIPKADRYTAFWDQNDNGQIEAPRELTTIDHILLAKRWSDRVIRADIPKTHDPRVVSDHYPVVVTLAMTGAPPVPTPPTGGGTLFIASALPNPEGDERQNEEVTIGNPETQAQNLAGWKLRDIAGETWSLEGVVPARAELTIRRNGQRMSLNNGGDTIELIAPDGRIVHTATYPRTEEGEVISFAR